MIDMKISIDNESVFTIVGTLLSQYLEACSLIPCCNCKLNLNIFKATSDPFMTTITNYSNYRTSQCLHGTTKRTITAHMFLEFAKHPNYRTSLFRYDLSAVRLIWHTVIQRKRAGTIFSARNQFLPAALVIRAAACTVNFPICKNNRCVSCVSKTRKTPLYRQAFRFVGI